MPSRHIRFYSLILIQCILIPSATMAMSDATDHVTSLPTKSLPSKKVLIRLPFCTYCPEQKDRAACLLHCFEAPGELPTSQSQAKKIMCDPAAFILQEIRIAKYLKCPSLASGILDSLDECDCWRYTRISHPEIRTNVEEQLLKLTKEKIDKQDPINYLSLGSGNLFQDLVIITKLLRHGYRSIRIILIDKSQKLKAFCKLYSEYHGSPIPADQLYTSPKISGHYSASFTPVIRQMVSWLAFVNKTLCEEQATIEIVLYYSDKHYQSDCVNGMMPQANIMTIVDLDIPDIPLQEKIIRSAYENLLKKGGIYAILTDQDHWLIQEDPAATLKESLAREMPLDSLLLLQDKKAIHCDLGSAFSIIQLYAGIKQ